MLLINYKIIFDIANLGKGLLLQPLSMASSRSIGAVLQRPVRVPVDIHVFKLIKVFSSWSSNHRLALPNINLYYYIYLGYVW